MMPPKITVVDYGVGNLFSVQRALEFCGAQNISVSSNPADIVSAERLILPGVGAFSDGMQGLRVRDLIDPIINYARSGGPLLGICLGMQMFATESEEFGLHAGLGLVPGRVVSIPNKLADGRRLKVPFIGWARLKPGPCARFENSCLKNIQGSDHVYLVHSFHVAPESTEHLLATYHHGDYEITAAIKLGNITGLQFHPEKSGQIGLNVIANFIADN
jgi:glutamine amidotransferase